MAKSHSSKRAQIEAVAYYRMSTDRQDKSIPEQREMLKPWAADNGYRIVAEYVDEGISGDKSREGFHQLVADSSSGKWSAMIMWDQDRWSRHDLVKTAYYVQQLRDSKIYMHTINQGRMDWESFEDRIVWAVQQESKHMYLVDLAKNTQRGIRSKAITGQLFVNPPRGYSKVPGPPASVILNEDAPLVRQAFEAYAAGHTIREVAEQLCESGMTNKNGGRLNPTSIKRMLQNSFYFGRYEFNRNQSGRKYAEPEEPIQIDDNHPAIVTKELFDRVQKRFGKNRTRTTPKKFRNYPLSGLLRCRCGAVLHARTAHNEKRYYRCQGGPYGEQTCKSERVVADEIEAALPVALAAAFTNPANIDRLQQSLATEIEKRANARQTAPDEAQKRVNSLQAKLRSVERRLAEVDSDMLEIIQDRIRELRKDIRKAEAQLSAARAAAGILGPEEIQAKQEQVIELLAKLPRTLSKLSAADQNRVLSELVERVDVKVNVLPPIQPKLHTRPRYELAGGVVFLASAIALNLFMPEMSTVAHHAGGGEAWRDMSLEAYREQYAFTALHRWRRPILWPHKPPTTANNQRRRQT